MSDTVEQIKIPKRLKRKLDEYLNDEDEIVLKHMLSLQVTDDLKVGSLQPLFAKFFPSFDDYGYARLNVNKEVITDLSKLDLNSKLTYMDLFPFIYTQAKQKMTPDTDMVVSAFQAKLQGEDVGLKLLHERVQSFVKQWQTNKAYYCPMLAIVNASMTGKSRLMCEFWRKNVFMFVICLRKEYYGEDFTPKRTKHIADWILSDSISDPYLFTERCCCMYYHSYRRLRKWLEKEIKTCSESGDLRTLAEKWFAYVIGGSLWKKITDEVRLCTMPAKTKESEVENCCTIIQSWTPFLGTELARIRALIQHCAGFQADGVHIVFAFDEAHQLHLSRNFPKRFVTFRRTLQAFPRNANAELLNTFSFMADTTLKLSNVADTDGIVEIGPSFRVLPASAVNGPRLFPPFSYVNPVDLWWHQAMDLSVDRNWSGPAIMQYLVLKLVRKNGECKEPADRIPLFKNLTSNLIETGSFQALFGRAAFFPYLVSRRQNEEQNVEALIEFLQAKLLCKDHSDFSESATDVKLVSIDEELLPSFGVPSETLTLGQRMKLSHVHALAIFGSIVSIEVSAASRLATELSSGHMRLLVGISKLRKLVYTIEVSEPLSACASHWLVIKGSVPWNVIIEKYLETQRSNSTVETGNRGEVAAQMLCAMAWQRIIEQNTRSFPSVSLKHFLVELLGPRFLQELASHPELEKILCSSFVRVNQFVRTFKPPTSSMLAEHYVRSSCIACKSSFQSVVDLVIPAFFPDGLTPPKNEAWKNIPVIAEKFGMCGFQTNLMQRSCSRTAVDEWMNECDSLQAVSSVNPPSVMIFCELGAKADGDGNPNIAIYPRPGRMVPYCIHVKGLRPFSTEIVQRAFDALLQFNNDISVNKSLDDFELKHMKTVFKVQPFNITRM